MYTRSGPRFLSISASLLAIGTIGLVLFVPVAEAQTYTILHSFRTTDGSAPGAGVVEDAAGHLYGTTSGGGGGNCGGGGCGTVYELTRTGFSWSEKVIHSFQGGDGEFPASP